MATWSARWQRLGKRQQLAVGLGGGLLVLWLVDTIALAPLRRGLHRLHQEVRETEQRLIDALIANQQAARVNEAYATYEPYVKPSGSPEAELAAEVESAVRDAGMTVLSLRPVTQRDATDPTVRVSVDGEASPAQLVKLFDRFQRSTQLLKITELTVRAAEGGVLRTSMEISKLLLKPVTRNQ